MDEWDGRTKADGEYKKCLLKNLLKKSRESYSEIQCRSNYLFRCLIGLINPEEFLNLETPMMIGV